MQRGLHEARTIDADARAPAPQIGRPYKPLGDLDEVARQTIKRGDLPRYDKAAARHFRELVVRLADGQHRIERQMHERRRFDIRRWIKKRSERLDAMRRHDHVARHGIGWQIANVTVARQLHPSPTAAFVEDGQSLAKQCFGFQAPRRVRRFAQRNAGAHHLASDALDVPGRAHFAFERPRGEIRAEGVQPWIERLSGRRLPWRSLCMCIALGATLRHVCNSRRRNSMTARAVCGSPPFGPSGRAEVRQP